DVSGDLVPGNTRRTTLTIIQDSEAPTFARPPASDEPLTRADGAVIRGTLADTIAPGVAWSPSRIALTVAGTRADVHADGTFLATVPLVEGGNTIELVAVDAAGNEALAWANVTRDTTAPALVLDAIPDRTTDARLIVTGHADPLSIVTVNGFVVPLVGDRFSRNVSLSGGDNRIVVRAEDAAGNVEERKVDISLVSVQSSSGWIAAIAAGGIVAFAIAFLLGRTFVFPPRKEEVPGEETGPRESVRPGEESEGAATVSETQPVAAQELPPPDAPAEDEFLPVGDEDPRAKRLRAAFESGKITREVYEANLSKVGKRS